MWTGERPSVEHLRIFGCRAHVLIESGNRKKFDAKSRLCVYLGPNYEGTGDKFYDAATKRVIVSRNVVFHEAELLMDRHPFGLFNGWQPQIDLVPAESGRFPIEGGIYTDVTPQQPFIASGPSEPRFTSPRGTHY